MTSYLRTPDTTPRKPKFPVIDAHNHLWGAWDRVADIVEAMDACGVVLYCDLTADISLEFGGGGYVIKPGRFQDFLDHVDRPWPEHFYGFTTAGMIRPPEPPYFEDADTFVQETQQKLQADLAAGACGLKLTKELGLLYRDAQGNLIAADDPRLQPIWQAAAEWNAPVLIHQADPIGFFHSPGPENEHTVNLEKFPAWNFSDRAKYPTFDQLQQRYQNLVRQNPKTTFILPHFANWPENLDYVGDFLDRFPNTITDFSARTDELGRQPYRAREFFLKYQDRILFGTDMPVSPEIYRYHYRFLETFDEYFVPPHYDGTFDSHRWKVFGIGLPDAALEKIYYGNALRWIPRLREKFGSKFKA